MLLSSESLEGIVWVQHNKDNKTETLQVFSREADHSYDLLDKSIRNYWLNAITSSNEIPIYLIEGDSCQILHSLAKAIYIDFSRCVETVQLSEEEMVVRIKTDMSKLYSGTDEVAWGLLFGAILCEAGNHHEAVMCFANLFETRITEIQKSIVADFLANIKEYYYETSWAWDYLFYSATFQDQWKKVCSQKLGLQDEVAIEKKLHEIDDREIIPPGLETRRYHIYRCRYLQAIRMGFNLLDEAQKNRINELHLLGDEFEYEDIRLLLHKAEHALDSGLVNKKNLSDMFRATSSYELSG